MTNSGVKRGVGMTDRMTNIPGSKGWSLTKDPTAEGGIRFTNPNGWQSSPYALVYASTDTSGHAFTYNTSGNLLPYISLGYRFMLTDSANGIQYFVVVAITSSTITLYGGNTYSATGLISNPYFSSGNAYGFPNYGTSSPIFMEKNASPGFSLGLNSGSTFTVTATAASSPSGGPYTLTISTTTAGHLAVGMNAAGAGITSATISAINTSTGVITLTGTISTGGLTASAYTFTTVVNSWYTNSATALIVPPGAWTLRFAGFVAGYWPAIGGFPEVPVALTQGPSPGTTNNGWSFDTNGFASTTSAPSDPDLSAAVVFYATTVQIAGSQLVIAKTIVTTSELTFYLAIKAISSAGNDPSGLLIEGSPGVGGSPILQASCAYIMPAS